MRRGQSDDFEMRASFERRLHILPQQDQITFAVRCAWRVLPFALHSGPPSWTIAHFEALLLACSVASLDATRTTPKSDLPSSECIKAAYLQAQIARDSIDNDSPVDASSVVVAAVLSALSGAVDNYSTKAAAAAAVHAVEVTRQAGFPTTLYPDDPARWFDLMQRDLNFLESSNSLEQIWKEPLFDQREEFQWREWAKAAWRKAPGEVRKKWETVWFGIASGKSEMVKLRANVRDWWSNQHDLSISSASLPPSNEIPAELPVAKTTTRRVVDHDKPTALQTDAIASANDLTPGAKRCAMALHAFLTAKGTSAPLTISVEGPWGGGKSSLMRAVQRQLQEEGHPTVWFNPWKHEAGPSLWAAFALSVEQSLSNQAGWLKSTSSRLQRVVFNMWPWRLMVASGTIALLACLLWKFYSIERPEVWPRNSAIVDLLTTLLNNSPTIAALLAAWAVFSQLGLQFGSPLAKSIEESFSSPTAAVQPSILTQIHRDFRLMLETTVLPASADSSARRTVFAFIDDLDRCEAPQAAELLQSLHMFINDDQAIGDFEDNQRKWHWLDWSPALTKWRLSVKKRVPPQRVGIIYVLGMDREKVAAAVATKHERLLPLLLDLSEQSGAKIREKKLTFGHGFLEKFINLTLHLPGIRDEDLRQFVNRSAGLVPEPPEKSQSDLPTLSPDTQQGSTDANASLSGPAQNQNADNITSDPTHQDSSPSITTEEALADVQLLDAPTPIAEWTLHAAELLDHNPRRLKQFINLLRLRLYLAAAAGIFESDADQHLDSGKLTFPQLAKLVALDLAHPELMSSFRKSNNHTGESLETLFNDKPLALNLINLSEQHPPCSLKSVVLSTYFNCAAVKTLGENDVPS